MSQPSSRPPSPPSNPVALHHVVDAAPDLPADAPVVVLGPSLGSTLDMWAPQVAALAEHFRVVRYDTRGGGSSPAPPGPYAVDDLADDVLALLDTLGVQRAHLVGLSLGGMTMMALAARAPQRVDRLALLCTTAAFDDLDPWRARVQRVRAEGTGAVAAGIVARWFTPAWAGGHPDVVQRAQGWIAAAPDDGYTACCEAVIGMDLRQTIPAITAPTLVIAGREDAATPPAHAEQIAAAIPGSLLQLVPGAHLANIESADLVTASLLEHLLPLGAGTLRADAPRATHGEDT